VGEDIADVDTIVDGTDGGIWGVRTRVNGGSLTEKLRINNVGAIGLGGANYGASGQVRMGRPNRYNLYTRNWNINCGDNN
jgi:hypothetical protein